MARTHGSRNKPKFPRVDDAYGQVFLDAPISGSAGAARASEYLMGSYLMSQHQLQDIYLANGFGRRIVDSVAEEMTRAGFTLENIADDVVERVQARIEELNAMVHLTNAIKWSRAFGGSAIVLGINDGGTLELPLNAARVKGVEFMRVYDRYEMSEAWKYSDPTKTEYGKTEIWRITPAQGGAPFLVHESRMLVFDGDPIPNRLRQMNQGWGASIMQKCAVELRTLNNGHKWANLLLQRSQQAVHGIPDLSNFLSTPEGRKAVESRVDIVDRVRNAQNTVVIDALETYEVLTASLGGVPDVLDRFAEALSTVTGIPIFVLMGRSIGGLNSTGESNERAWHSQIENLQQTILKNPLDRLVSFIILGASEGKTDGANYSLVFNPLAVPTDKDQAETDSKRAAAKKATADARQVYVNMGALDPLEVRDLLLEDDEFKDHIDVSLEPTPPAEIIAEKTAEAKGAARAGQPAGKPGGNAAR